MLENATVDDSTASWEFDQPYLMFALSVRVMADRVAAPVRIEMPLSFSLVTA